jgi:hypothetical protein
MKASTQAVIKKVGPVGGSGGVVKDMNINGINRIVEISVRHSSVIHALIVRFIQDTGEESTEVWGGRGGNLAEVLPFFISKLIEFQLCEREVKSLISW